SQEGCNDAGRCAGSRQERYAVPAAKAHKFPPQTEQVADWRESGAYKPGLYITHACDVSRRPGGERPGALPVTMGVELELCSKLMVLLRNRLRLLQVCFRFVVESLLTFPRC